MSEAHDSGLCAGPARLRGQLATDILNLTLAAPEVNRCGPGGKCGFDAGEWFPPLNQCWFVGRVVLVKRRYGFTMDMAEARAIEAVLASCTNFEMVGPPG